VEIPENVVLHPTLIMAVMASVILPWQIVNKKRPYVLSVVAVAVADKLAAPVIVEELTRVAFIVVPRINLIMLVGV